jgi:syntaxin 1B/2/3
LIQQSRAQIKQLASYQDTDAKLKDTQQKSLAKKLMDVAKEFQNIQRSARSNYKNQMERQYRIARPNASEDEVRQAMENPSGRVFQQTILTAGMAEQRRALEEVQNRNNEIQKLEKSIGELVQLFQDMELLLDNQQVLVNSIEVHVDNTFEHMEAGSKQLTSAIEHAKSARKRKWCIFIFVLILLAIVGVLLYLFVFRHKGDNKK